MARALRRHSATGVYHVTSRALRPLRLFEGASDCAAFFHVVERVHREDGLLIHAYCLMGTHFHLLVRAEPDGLARSMQRVKSRYAQEMNRRRDRVGPFFDARYGSFPVESDEHVFAAFVYLSVNPVQAGLVTRPEQWPFSSHRAHAALHPRPNWLLPIDASGVFADAATYTGVVDAAVAEIHRRRANGMSSEWQTPIDAGSVPPAPTPPFGQARPQPEAKSNRGQTRGV